MPEKTRSWITTVASTVSVAIAAVTIYIIVDIAHEARNEESRNRSLSLITGFSSLSSRQALESLSTQIFLRDIQSQTEHDTRQIRIERYNEMFADVIEENIDQVRVSISEILRLTDSVYACAWFLPEETDEEDKFCDREMLYVIYFPQLSSLFFAFRPLLYCDPVISKIYAGSSLQQKTEKKLKKNQETQNPLKPWEMSIMHRVEEMIYDYLDWDHKTKQLDKRVFYTHEAAEKEGFGEGTKRAVVKPKQDFCDQYPFGDTHEFV